MLTKSVTGLHQDFVLIQSLLVENDMVQLTKPSTFYFIIKKNPLFASFFFLELPKAPIIFIMHLEMWNLSSHATWFLRFYKIAFFTYAHIKCLIESMTFFFFFLQPFEFNSS